MMHTFLLNLFPEKIINFTLLLFRFKQNSGDSRPEDQESVADTMETSKYGNDSVVVEASASSSIRNIDDKC